MSPSTAVGAPEVVASIRPRDAGGGRRLAATAVRDGADVVELRIDDWPWDADLEGLLAALPVPVILTCRTPRDGGGFAGSLEDRRRLLERGVAAGASRIDLEDWEDWSPTRRVGLRVVRSHHDLVGVPRDLPALRDRLFASGGDVAKIAGTTTDLAEARPLLELCAATDPREQPTVAFALGEAAWPTRILACMLGAPLIYASVEPGEQTAAGQLPVALLVELYRVHALSRRTALFGLLGDPALRSLGPRLHNRFFGERGIDAVYLPFETARPTDVIEMLAALPLRGLSVTAPHKAAVLPLCDELDAVAEQCGAVNTLIFGAGGAVRGHNTDVDGVRGALQRAGVRDGPGTGVVLGTGGAARAAAVALEQMGRRVTLLSRSPERAPASGWPVEPLTAGALRGLEPAVIVQATPVGAGPEPLRLLPDWTPQQVSTVLDMVYRPACTPLLQDAAAAGAVAVSGVEMFLDQAAAQLALFTGGLGPAPTPASTPALTPAPAPAIDELRPLLSP